MSNPFHYTFILARSVIYRRGKGKRNRTILRLAFLIILLMIPLILSLSFTEGMIEGITRRYILLQDGHLQFYADLSGEDLAAQVEGVAHVDHTVGGYGIAYSSDESREVYLKGVLPSYFDSERREELSLRDDSLLERTGALPGLYLSESLALQFGAALGDRLAIVTLPSEGQGRVRPSLAVVKGIFSTGFYALDDALMFIDMNSARLLFPATGGKSEIILTSEYADAGEQIAEKIESYLGRDLTWAGYDEFNTEMYENFATSRQIIFAVFLVILFAAIFYVTAVSHELIEDAKEEIAMQKVLGARSFQILTGYLIALGSVTLVSILTGTALGMLLSTRITSILSLLSELNVPSLRYYLLTFDITIPYWQIARIVMLLFLMSLISVGFSLRRIIHIRALDMLQQE